MSSFIERFAIVGTAGVVGLMVVAGIYGFASLLGADPEESLPNAPPAEEEVAGPDRPVDSARADVLRSEATPRAESGEAPPVTPTPRANTPRPTDAPPRQAAVLAEARPGGGIGGPAAPPAAAPTPAPPPGAVATPAPNAPDTPPSTPQPPAPTPGPPAPTPQPAACPTGDPQVDWHGKRVRFTYGSVVSFGGGVLVVDVGGTRLSLLVTGGTEVVGVLGAATVVSGQGHRSNDGSIVAQYVEVVCPEWAR